MSWRCAATAITFLVSGTLFPQDSYCAEPPQRHHAVASQPPVHVACTVLGCMPIPAACRPVAGKTPGGIPTGYDVIVCPPGVSPWR
jgi:hypothetical protein